MLSGMIDLKPVRIRIASSTGEVTYHSKLKLKIHVYLAKDMIIIKFQWVEEKYFSKH